jgi:acyl-CoA thioesterase-1
MRRWVLKFLGLAALLLVNTAGAAAPAIVVLGDSLSSGYGLGGAASWVMLLERRLRDEGYEYAVVNASIAGDTSAGGLSRLPRLLEVHAPEFVVLELGGNDGLRGQPVGALRGNLERMIELIQGSGARVVLAGIQIPPNYGPQYTQQLAAVYPELAQKYDIPLVEFLMDGVALNGNLMQADRIHPNADGQPIMLDNVWAVLSGMLRTAVQ